MTVALTTLLDYCDQLLKPQWFKDYCPNGLQIEGRAEINKIITGVTASQALIDQAIAEKADAILVHHGYFWRGEKEPLVGMKGRRVKSLMQQDISLIAYHLPLDAHPSLGNNAQLAQLLNFDIEGGMDSNERPVGVYGSWCAAKNSSLHDLSVHIEQCLKRKPLVIGELSRQIENVAWCTGSAQSMLEKAYELGVDCFISGEISENTVHAANELGIAYISAGHHATERYGVKALGEHLAEQLSVDVRFVDIDNPV